MKKLFFSLMAIAVITFTGCHKEKTDFEKLTKVSEMLYEVTYDSYSSNPVGTYNEISGDMACSCVRNGNYHGRNFDYFMNQTSTIVVHTTAKNGRYATIGVGRLAKVNDAMIDAGLSDRQLEILPWAVLDGMNEKGLVVSNNVVSKGDWGETPHTGTTPGAPELNIIHTTRALLDNCATVDEALTYLNEHNITPFESEYMNLHIMISDPTETYVVEIINNEIVARPQTIMTNYHVFLDGIPEHAIGVERYNILNEHYAESGESMESMWELMKRVSYTNSYNAENKWYSDHALTYGIFYSEIPQYQNFLDSISLSEQNAWAEEKAYIKQNGFREDTEWWDTTHNTIYDIANKKVWVTLHEGLLDSTIHKFCL